MNLSAPRAEVGGGNVNVAIAILAIVVVAAGLGAAALLSSDFDGVDPAGAFALSVRSCADSDGGKSYLTAGTVSVTFNNRSNGSFPDRCKNNGQLKEFFCGSRKVKDIDVNCRRRYNSSYFCSNGACVMNASGSGGGGSNQSNQTNGSTGNTTNGTTGNTTNGTSGNTTNGSGSNGSSGNWTNGTAGNQTNGTTGNQTGNGSAGNATNLTHPFWFSPRVNTTNRSQPALFSAFWRTNRTFAGGGYIFSWNGTNNTMRNDSWVSFGTSANTAWSNVTKILPNGSTFVRWIVYANNSANEWNGTVNGLSVT